MALNTFSELQGDVIPVCFNNPGEDRTIYKGSTLRTFTNLQHNTLAQNNVVTEQEQKQSAVTKYDLRNVLQQAKPVLNESSHAKFAQLLRDSLDAFSKDEWNIRHLVQYKNQV